MAHEYRNANPNILFNISQGAHIGFCRSSFRNPYKKAASITSGVIALGVNHGLDVFRHPLDGSRHNTSRQRLGAFLQALDECRLALRAMWGLLQDSFLDLVPN